MDYRKVLVVGAKAVGKSTLLASSVNYSYSEEYTPTLKPSSYFSTEHQLELIDTPGIHDNVFGDNFSGGKLKQLEHRMDMFTGDPLVGELVPERAQWGERKRLLGLDAAAADAYLIVYSDMRAQWEELFQEPNQNIAKALWRLLKDEARDKDIFLVRNVATSADQHDEIPAGSKDMFSELDDKAHRDIGRIFNPTIAFHHDKSSWEDVKNSERTIRYLGEVCAQTGQGIAEMLDAMSEELGQNDRPGRRMKRAASRSCEAPGDCVIL